MGSVDCSIDGGIATVTFTNPPKGFLTSAMVAQASDIMARLEDDEAVRVIVFTGGLPDVFIRHFSVEEIIEMTKALKARRARGQADPRFARTPLRMLWENIDNSRKPTIAAINGYCGGGGCELALACDIRLAGPGDYTIGQMEILVGILPGAGGTTRLARLVGTGKALEWVLRGRTFHPQEAAAEGLVHHYVEGDVLAAAHDMAREFLDKPAAALAAIKQVLRSSWGKSTADGVDEEGDLFANLIASDARALEMMEDYVAGGHQLKKF
ncbi:MAG: enoyl-CoA hydratase/isomerase family protein [Gammaproteobacteria bacterium]|nr:enoyl-CoA hydratase/isomerase family protein [Gammaproteobacteria bacterium]MCP5202208.1 enoyl-CoA hydratase/isomerase family protein [Gammaproteobacteria bacterium]